MSTMQLYSIKAALFGAACPLGVCLNQRLNLLHGQLSGHLPNDGVGNRRRGYGLLTSKVGGKCFPPGMMQLDSDFGTSSMNPAHKAA